MNTYSIRINGKWFVGEGEVNGRSPTGGWYDEGKSVKKIVLSDDHKEAKKIEGMFNLKSYFHRIYDACRYGETEFEIEELSFVKVGEEE